MSGFTPGHNTRPRALDLFCGAGGAAMGLYRAGYDVTGVDIRPQPRFPFHFIQADALLFPLDGYDLIWASPPCQFYSEATPIATKHLHPALIPAVQARLRTSGIPYIIENVECARRALSSPVMLCGSMFNLGVWRHRYFEIGNVDAFFLTPPCRHDFVPVAVYGGGPGSNSRNNRHRGKAPVAVRRSAMGIEWMTGAELAQAIPPAYSEFLASQL